MKRETRLMNIILIQGEITQVQYHRKRQQYKNQLNNVSEQTNITV